MAPQFWLILAILAEVIGTTALKASNGFSRLGPALVVVLGYGTSFYALSLALRSLPLGPAYAIWSGVGLVLITLVGWWFWDQRLSVQGLIGMALIAAGVLILNLGGRGH